MQVMSKDPTETLVYELGLGLYSHFELVGPLVLSYHSDRRNSNLRSSLRSLLQTICIFFDII